ncbi:DUF2852 domain-containing protein [Falsiroseomonas oryziterrae]|uniref:DUF2852 domain-containing protein n=1 Tax=Falsiroseomonas oryziterrae TaxID=2911368 RepID=UPI001F31EBAB|nr:DUF2852 domain-containing protein [Roseomonas sp. NPKOSM-4]
MSAAAPALPADLPPGLARRWERHQRRQMRREARQAYWAARGGHPLRGWRLPAMILGFIAWWPIGLALLAFFFWRPAMSCNSAPWSAPWSAGWMTPWKDRMRDAAQRATGPVPTGNAAFDEYREGVLKRLEEERRQLDAQQAEFAEFLKQLRRAKDQEEFDRFMEGRRPQA